MQTVHLHLKRCTVIYDNLWISVFLPRTWAFTSNVLVFFAGQFQLDVGIHDFSEQLSGGTFFQTYKWQGHFIVNRRCSILFAATGQPFCGISSKPTETAKTLWRYFFHFLLNMGSARFEVLQTKEIKLKRPDFEGPRRWKRDGKNDCGNRFLNQTASTCVLALGFQFATCPADSSAFGVSFSARKPKGRLGEWWIGDRNKNGNMGKHRCRWRHDGRTLALHIYWCLTWGQGRAGQDECCEVVYCGRSPFWGYSEHQAVVRMTSCFWMIFDVLFIIWIVICLGCKLPEMRGCSRTLCRPRSLQLFEFLCVGPRWWNMCFQNSINQ